MSNSGFHKSNRYALHRYIILFISVFYAINLFAQRDIPRRLNDALLSKDTQACQNLIRQITDSDISQMADSTLLDYYYLAGWNASESNQLEKTIDYLVKAKELCETRLGIHNDVFVYLEILMALGETCEELGRNDEALLWYEEGLVKSFPYLKINDTDLQAYLRDIRNNAAKLFEQKGHVEMARYLKDERLLGDEGSFDYACDLLDLALKLNNEGESNEAIKMLDTAKAIFLRYGVDGKEMMNPLYREYLMCFASIGDTKQIDKLIRSKKRIMFQDNDESFLVQDMNSVIASFINIHHDIKTADKYYQYIVREHDKSNPDDVAAVTELGKTLDIYKRVYSRIDSLEQIRISFVLKDYKWGVISYQLANLLIRVHREYEADKICKDVYVMSSELQEDPENLHWFILMNLADYAILQKDLSDAERFLKEQLEWLDLHNIATDAEERGWVYNKFGIVYMNSARYDDCNSMLLKAEEILLPIYKKESAEYATILHNRGRLAQLQGKLDEAKTLLTESQRIQRIVNGEVMDKTVQYLSEVEQAIKTNL